MEPINTPVEFPYGDELKRLFDRMYEETQRAFSDNIFKTVDRFWRVGGYLKLGNQMYRPEDKKAVAAALDIRDAGLIMPLNDSDIDPEKKRRIAYYRVYAGYAQEVIDKNNIKELDAVTGEPIEGRPLNITDAFAAYGNYRLQQIDRFDYRVYRFSQPSQSAWGDFSPN